MLYSAGVIKDTNFLLKIIHYKKQVIVSSSRHVLYPKTLPYIHWRVMAVNYAGKCDPAAVILAPQLIVNYTIRLQVHILQVHNALCSVRLLHARMMGRRANTSRTYKWCLSNRQCAAGWTIGYTRSWKQNLYSRTQLIRLYYCCFVCCLY